MCSSCCLHKFIPFWPSWQLGSPSRVLHFVMDPSESCVSSKTSSMTSTEKVPLAIWFFWACYPTLAAHLPIYSHILESWHRSIKFEDLVYSQLNQYILETDYSPGASACCRLQMVQGMSALFNIVKWSAWWLLGFFDGPSYIFFHFPLSMWDPEQYLRYTLLCSTADMTSLRHCCSRLRCRTRLGNTTSMSSQLFYTSNCSLWKQGWPSCVPPGRMMVDVASSWFNPKLSWSCDKIIAALLLTGVNTIIFKFTYSSTWNSQCWNMN